MLPIRPMDRELSLSYRTAPGKGSEMGNEQERLDELLLDLDVFINRFIMLPSIHHSNAVTLWVAATWMKLIEFDAWAYLAITSAEKGSGKTRLLEVMQTVVCRPWFTTMPSPAALYTKIEQSRPTVLLDEVDAV